MTVETRPPSLAFVGAGHVGSRLARALSEAGLPVVAIASRRLEPSQVLAEAIPGCRAMASPQDAAAAAGLVFLTVPDDHIREVARAIRWRGGQFVVHCSGAHGADLLDDVDLNGALAGAFHPLQTFARPDVPLAGCTFAVDAPDPLAGILSHLAQSLGGRPLALPPESRALYHLSASIAGNFAVTLLAEAARLWQPLGLPREDALAALLPLVRTSIENVAQLGPAQALTGPIARGDAGTVHRHLQALQQAAPDIMDMYRELALRTIELALEKGTLRMPAAGALRKLLTESTAADEDRT